MRSLNKAGKNVIASLASWEPTRALLNSAYNRLSYPQCELVHARLSTLFRERNGRARSGMWRINFAGKQIIIPLKSNRMWLDWDAALSTLGHDVAIKETYEYYIKNNPPDIFIDIGSNYGTHSILFLAHGIKTISFEPNNVCNEYFRELCKANNVSPDIREVALSDSNGCAELSFPPNEEWLGSIKPDWHNRSDLVTRQVEVKRLDDYEFTGRLLIKIDTEGNEMSVLKGAAQTLARCRPPVIFESFDLGYEDLDERRELFDFFALAGYRIAILPWVGESEILPYGRFLGSSASNFIAIPNLARP